MKRIEIVPYTIGDYFASLVVNGDLSGLTNEEVRLFDEFCETVKERDAPSGYTFGHWAINDEEYDEFSVCEITGLRGPCCLLEAIYFHNKA